MLKKIPHTYVIIFGFIVLSAVLTWFIPGGSFERETIVVNNIKREVIRNNSFTYIEKAPQTWQIFSALFKGFENTSNIIVFILIIGGSFWIMNETRSIDIGILKFVGFTHRFNKYKFLRYLGIDNIVITTIMLVFSVFGAVFGMSEETIAFIIIFVPLSISMGYDSIIGVSMCFVGAGLGFAGALLNPFTIGIAQGLSQIPLFSGIEYRLVCWVIINIAGITYVLRYARRIKGKAEASPVHEDDEYWRKKSLHEENNPGYKKNKSSWWIFFTLLAAMILYSFIYPVSELQIGNKTFTFPAIPVFSGLFFITSIFTLRKSVHFFILNLLTFTIIYLIIGVMGYDWYVMEIATIFFVLGISSGIAMDYSANNITKLFIAGSRDILSAALVVGLAGGIVVILQDGRIIDTILYGISNMMQDFGKIASVSMMYVFQTFLNIIIPSGSGKAALTMPIMSQFSDLIGVSRQATVMAFQFGDGFTNMITPTSGVLIGVLEVARIPYDKWLKWVAPLILLLFILGIILLIPTVTMKLSGF